MREDAVGRRAFVAEVKYFAFVCAAFLCYVCLITQGCNRNDKNTIIPTVRGVG